MRLIDADKLLKIINDDIEITLKHVNNEGNSSRYYMGLGELDSLQCYRGIVEDLPTVYDVDKVVKQLEERSQLIRPVGWMKHYEVITTKEVLEIVKAGGIE